MVDAKHVGVWELPVLGEVTAPAAVLIRPDGHVAWVGDLTHPGLPDALDHMVRTTNCGGARREHSRLKRMPLRRSYWLRSTTTRLDGHDTPRAGTSPSDIYRVFCQPAPSMSSSLASKIPDPIKVTRDMTDVTIDLPAVVDSTGPRGTDGSARRAASCGEQEERDDELCDDSHGQLVPVSAAF